MSVPPLALDLADPAGRYRAVALVVVAGIGAAAFARGRAGSVLATTVPAAAVAGLAVVADRAGDAAALAALTLAVGLATRALAAVGARLGAPALAASAVAALTLWTACGGLWWADRVAALVSPDRRAPVREAVLGADPLAAAAYALGYDRLHAPDVYDATTISSTTVRAPDAATTALAWSGLALAAGLGSGLAARRRPAPQPGFPTSEEPPTGGDRATLAVGADARPPGAAASPTTAGRSTRRGGEAPRRRQSPDGTAWDTPGGPGAAPDLVDSWGIQAQGAP